jgi:hypothetical protein
MRSFANLFPPPGSRLMARWPGLRTRVSQREESFMKGFDATWIAGASFVACLSGCASLETGMTPAVPENLKAPATQKLSVAAHAKGVQIYECKASPTDSTRFEWAFVAPEAELFDTSGKNIGKHYGGPTWESNDGSKVVGAVKSRDNGPDANAIPWLLLNAKSTAGNGVFSKTQSIQRVNTVGGKAPAGGCDKAQAGKIARVAYQAMYYFYVAGS